MSKSAFSPSSQRSRRDLLRALKLSDDAADKRALALALGYQSQCVEPENSEAVPPKKTASNSLPLEQLPISENPEPKLQLPDIWYIKRDESTRLAPEHRPTHAIEVPEKTQALADKFFAEPSLSVAYWRAFFESARAGLSPRKAWDIPRLSTQLAKAETPRHIPRKQRRTAPARVRVLIDGSDHLRPLFPDYDRAVALCRQLFTPSTLSFQVLDGAPSSGGELSSELEHELSDLTSADALFYLGDAGAFCVDNHIAQSWQRCFERLRHSGAAIYQQPLPTANHSLCEQLLAVVALCESCVPARLRFIREQLNLGGLAEELAIWNHPHMRWPGTVIELRERHRVRWSRELQAWTLAKRQLAIKVIKAWSAHLAPETNTLQQLKLAGYGYDLAPDVSQLLNDWQRPGSNDQAALRNWLLARDGVWHQAEQQLKDEHALVDLFTSKRQLLQGFSAGELSLRRTAIQSGPDLLFKTKKSPLAIGEFELHAEHAERISAQDVPVQLYQRGRQLQLDVMQRPNWAERLWRERDGIHAAHPAGFVARLQEAGAEHPQARWLPEHNSCPWAESWGVDAHGLWAEFSLSGVVQRMRWIVPGSFLMGSPDTEADRDDDERQHPVTLRRGYWLADTACSQALWQAVTVENPSRFVGDPNRPVEKVSWHDAVQYIEAINGRVTGLQLRLPSEAEWEYACRAGTDIAFHFGEHLTPELANYDGNFPWRDQPKGQYRQTTLPVKHFRPNDWGLYQMHGNVIEWCRDWYKKDYPSGALTNPKGPSSGQRRVCRGGSWLNFGSDLRAAYRYHYSPDDRSNFLGFRLAGGDDPQASTGIALGVDRGASGAAPGSNDERNASRGAR